MWDLGTASVALFSGCLLCHGELARRRPPVAELTRFYLWTSAGGALGGVAVSLLAPLVFLDYFELPLAIIGIFFALLLLPTDRWVASQRTSRRVLLLSAAVVTPWLAGALYVNAIGQVRGGQVLARSRGFFGTLLVTRFEATTLLTHGRIRHGAQFNEAARRAEPTMYFGRASGAGRVLSEPDHSGPRRVGVIGLGAGTLAVYGRAGDHFRFYELDQRVVDLAKQHFSFLDDSAANISVVTGDGRVAMASEPANRFDVLVMDAFSSDSVPTHLLPPEAFELYLRHLVVDGILLANVSNRFLAVERVVAGSAEAKSLVWAIVDTPNDEADELAHVRWAVMARQQARLAIALAGVTRTSLDGTTVRWSDDSGSLLSIIR